MADSAYSTTAILRKGASASLLNNLQSQYPDGVAGKEIFSAFEAIELGGAQSTEKDLWKVEGESRRGCQGYWTQRLCEMANISGLGFLYNSLNAPADFSFRMGGGYENRVFLLTKPRMLAAVAAIERCFTFALQNLDDLTDLFGEDDESLREAIDTAWAGPRPNGADYGEYGEGPWYFFAYLLSIKTVLLNALQLDTDAVHVSDAFFSEPVRIA